ncbi:MAG: ELM1/GtrOC1 family putative glycosyltransferase [Alphaproteobacteria bacterium]
MTKETSTKILLLFDKNRGHQLQLIALAESLSAMMPIEYEMVRPGYGWLAKLPVWSRRPWFSGLKNFSSKLDRVDMIFSAGHITARPALFLKNRLRATKVVHLLSPNGGGRFFDLLIRPFHECKKNMPANMMAVMGGLSKWRDKNLLDIHARAKNLVEKKIPNLDNKKSKIGVLLGGNSRLQVFNKKTTDGLLQELNILAKNNFLFITPSSRTPSAVRLRLQKEFSFHSHVWLDDGRDNNVYGMILAYSDFFIATNDSINMMTECLLTGKGVFLYPLPYRNFLSVGWQLKKFLRHKKFLNIIKDNFSAMVYEQKNIAPMAVVKKNIINSDKVSELIKKWW